MADGGMPKLCHIKRPLCLMFDAAIADLPSQISYGSTIMVI